MQEDPLAHPTETPNATTSAAEPEKHAPSAGGLLAVDVGLRMGLALYGTNGRLCWVRSRHVGTLPALRKTAHAMLRELPQLATVVLEGGGPAGEIWQRCAAERNITVQRVSAEVWRRVLLLERQQRTGSDAKRHAVTQAMQIIRWSGLVAPRSVSDDAAEAILIGLWGVMQAGWLRETPPFLAPVPASGSAREMSPGTTAGRRR